MIECACGCNELIPETDNYGRPHKFKHGHNKARLGQEGLKGEAHPSWKGGKSTHAGYVLIKTGYQF